MSISASRKLAYPNRILTQYQLAQWFFSGLSSGDHGLSLQPVADRPGG